MIFFILDTSSVLKRYRAEKGSDFVDKIVNYKKARVFIPNICIPQVLFLFEALHKFGDRTIDGTIKKLTKDEREFLRSTFLEDVRERRLYPYDLHRNHIINVDQVYAKSLDISPGRKRTGKVYKPIDTIDTLILSMAIELHGLYKTNLLLVTSDTHMKKVAEALKIGVVDPEKPPAYVSRIVDRPS